MAKNKAEAVLIARFSAIGDVAMTIPVVYSACRENPEAQFVMLTRKGLQAMFINPPSNLTVEAVDLSSYKGVGGIWRLASELKRKYNFNRFVDLHNVIRTRIIGFYCALHGISTHRLDKGRSEKKKLVRQKRKHFKQLKLQVDRYAEVFAKAGLGKIDYDGFNGVFEGSANAPAEMFEKITGPKPAASKWVAVAPFAAHEGKVYPIDLMEKVVDRLTQIENITIFLLGGGGKEAQILDGWAQKYKNAVSLAGKRYGFATEMALLNHCDVALTMDSANMHLAALAQVPTVSIWGATHPYAGFNGLKQTDFVQLSLNCRPCSVFGNKKCRISKSDRPCLSRISPALIADTIIKRL